MTYRGHVKNGVVVLDEPGSLPEGAEVRIELSASTRTASEVDENGQTLGERLLQFAGRATDLPADMARNLDHYLYGVPKQ